MRKRFLAGAAASLCTLAVAQSQAAEHAPYPARPIRLIVPTAPGGGTDNVVRNYAPRLGQILGQQIIVDNRAGAGGSIGAAIASRAPADGYTLLATFASHATNPAVMKDTGFDLVKHFQPVTLTVVLPTLLVAHPSLGVKDVKSLIALARSQPGKIQYASGTFGASSHLGMELFQSLTKTKMMVVPYKGVGPATTAVVAGETQLMIGNLLSTLPQVKQGRLVALAVTSAKRANAAPDIPTLSEAGVPGYQADNWSGLLAPAGTPKPIVAKVYAATVQAITDPQVTQRFVAEGGEPAPSKTPEEFGAFVKAEVQKWSRVAKNAGIEPQ
jgi:tripartite-type tricarboxylate transporter receptor subunit TctC